MIEAFVWLLALSAAWLCSQAAIWGVVFLLWFDFPAFHPAAWRQLYGLFMAGGTIGLDFVAALAGMALVTAGGQIWLFAALPGLLSWLPPLPATSLPALRKAKRRERRERREPKPMLPQRPVPPRQTPAPVSPAPASPAGKLYDSACVARMLALFEVWSDPPQDWIKEAMRDEAARLSDQAWPILRELGAVGVRLAALLQAEGLLPREASAVFALEEMPAAPTSDGAAPPASTSEFPAPLTMGAAWLCELLDHFAPDDGQTAEDLLGRAMRGMTAEDWASLDHFPEKAGKVRVLTDRLAEDFRRGGKTVPSTPVELLQGLLRQFGFEIQPAVVKNGFWAEREGLALLLSLIDLKQRRWRLPSGPLGPWLDCDGADAHPGRELWKQLSTQRLRRPSGTRLEGVVVVHGGWFEDEDTLCEVARDGVAVAWLNEQGGALPDLQNHLGRLTDGQMRIRPHPAAERHAAALP